MTRLKVAHVPARTPYARKLTSEHVRVLNGSEGVPRDLTLKHVLARRPFNWFDVLHLHHVEFDDLAVLRLVLSECARAGRRVVFTAHDVAPVFTSRRPYQRKLRTLVEWNVPFICLTWGSAAELHARLGPSVRTVVAPHGYVVSPDELPAPARGAKHRFRYLMFGSLRENRDVPTVLHNWRFGRQQRETELQMLLRAPAPVNLEHDGERPVWDLISSMAVAESRLKVDIAPFPTDEEVADTAVGCDALILPYKWGTHSGQLELAFDLGLLPITSMAGYLYEQYQQHEGLAPEPVWFDWSDGNAYSYGERFLRALDRAVTHGDTDDSTNRRADFAEHRRAEHEKVMAVHHDLYERPWT
ncbi:hypothetical protein [Nocardiopsis sp. NPDC006938]|uniref:hypothetical protein n=1 Tax=Nocardiopsis sp. NPDC006938 TaxID=3364337 RepID=UPI0036CB4C97